MDPILAEISTRYPDARQDGLKYRQCLLTLMPNPRRSSVVLDLDVLAPRKKHVGALADRAVVLGDIRIDLLVFEFKEGDLDVKKVHNQLDGGARLMKKILNGNAVSGFLPVWVFKKLPPKAKIRALQATLVRYRPGFERRVFMAKCGQRILVSIDSDGLLVPDVK